MLPNHPLDPEACYLAVKSKDPRFDGVFYLGVTSTGIYCRPSCPAITPKRTNLTFHRTAAAAQEAGFRACKRCRPDAAPGSPEWNMRQDLVGRAMRLIADGAVDREGVRGLAAGVGYSERQLNRQLVAEVGAGPLALARAQRARTARTLLEASAISVSDVAFVAGFASIRQFNDTIREIFDATPTELRRSANRSGYQDREAAAGSVTVRLPYRRELDVQSVIDFLGRRAVSGIEEFGSGTYTRSMSLPHGAGVAALSIPGEPNRHTSSWVNCELWLDDLRDLTAAVQRCRRMLDLDTDPTVIDEQLAQSDVLRPLVQTNPGLPLPGSTDPNEVAFRVVIGQQVSTAGARTVAGRLVASYGSELTQPVGGVTHTFPAAAALAEADPADFAMPQSRKKAINTLAVALANEAIVLSPGSDWEATEAALLALYGIGPWTVAAIRMRALGDPDVFLPTDLGIRKAVALLGQPSDPKSMETNSQAWRPWRSYTTHHLWAYLDTSAHAHSGEHTDSESKGRN